jgi:hypothetical protein
VEVREGDQKLGRAGEQAEEQAHHGGTNGDGGGWFGCSGARGKEKGGSFIGPGACRGGCSVAAWPIAAREWARGGGDVRRSRRPMAEGGARGGELAVAAWHRPKPPRVRHGR